MTEFLTVRQSAKFLNLCPQRINFLIKEQRIAARWCECGQLRLIAKDELERYKSIDK